jgi:hypothetical protein
MVAGVLATQDTRAFVEERTLPMIASLPGFRAVWMARSTRDSDRAVLATSSDAADATEPHGLAAPSWTARQHACGESPGSGGLGAASRRDRGRSRRRKQPARIGLM